MESREYTARARFALRNAGHVIAELCDHMREHDAEVCPGPAGPQIRLGPVRAQFSREGEETLVDIMAPDLEGLYFARMSVASHILEFAADDPPDIAWTGDGGEIVRPPNFHILDVIGCRTVTPHMRRLTFAGQDVARFASLDALHLNLMIQHPDAVEPQWPRVGANGVISWDRPHLRPIMRKYTVRSVDIAAGTLAIDFVLHKDEGPGSAFARTAAVGDRVGVIGPGGGGLAAADWYLFAGDETALPAIARMLEHLPAGARGKACIEVFDEGDVQDVSAPAAIDIEWLFRKDRAADAPSRLVDAVRDVQFLEGNESIYVWAGCEFDAFRAIRAFMRKERSLKSGEHLVVSYWRRGHAEKE